MEAETRDGGEGQGAESENEVSPKGGEDGAASGSRFQAGRRKQEAFDAGESGSGKATQTGGQAKAKAESFAGTPGPTGGRDESALGGEKSCDGDESAERIERSRPAGAVSRKLGTAESFVPRCGT